MLTSAAVELVACEEGKLSLDGVPTPIRIAGSCGRGRRTMRLMNTLAACAIKAETPTPSHSARSGLSAAAPAAEPANQRSACPPKRVGPRATRCSEARPDPAPGPPLATWAAAGAGGPRHAAP